MNYILHTPSAARLKKEILDKVSEKVAARSTLSLATERTQALDLWSLCFAKNYLKRWYSSLDVKIDSLPSIFCVKSFTI